jgi:hypothetical protein
MGLLKVASGLTHAATLKAEGENFKVKVNLRGNETYESWRESDHDDLLFFSSFRLLLGGTYVPRRVAGCQVSSSDFTQYARSRETAEVIGWESFLNHNRRWR